MLLLLKKDRQEKSLVKLCVYKPRYYSLSLNYWCLHES
jgi:hypothetical protein